MLKTTEIDPYLEWLHVRVPAGAPNHYQLLGLGEFESDSHLINQAFRSQVSLLRSNRPAGHSSRWEQLQEELNEAGKFLRNKQLKSVYDAFLRRKQRKITPFAGAKNEQAAVVCSSCQRSNSGKLAYCVGCGKSLWASCPNCQTVLPAAEKYCGSCGDDLTRAHAQRQQHFESALENAAELMNQCRYALAGELLFEVACCEDPLYDELAEQALAQLQQIDRQRQEDETRVSSAVQRAEELLTARKYNEVLAEIEKVPAAIQNEPLQQLRGRAQAGLDKAAALLEKIRQAAQAKSFAELSEAIDQMLAIVPDHEETRKLAVSFRARLLKAARAQLEKYQYADARKLIQLIPQSAHNEEVDHLMQEVVERLWLFTDFKQSPVIDPALPAIAKRLHTLAPGDARVGELCSRLEKKTKASAQGPYVAWGEDPKQTRFGVPVALLAGFRRIDDRSFFSQSAGMKQFGSFHVAAGLALQALGKSAITHQLAPPPEKSKKKLELAVFSRKKPAAPTAGWGIDLGTSALKAVRLVTDEQGAVSLDQCCRIPYCSADDDSALQQAIRQFLKTQTMESDPVCASQGSATIIGRFVVLPPVAEEQVPALIDYEVKHQMTFRMDDITWGHHLFCDESRKEQLPSWYAAFQVTRRSLVQKRLDLLQRCGLRIDMLQSETAALYNYAMFDLAEGGKQSTFLLLDVGGDSTNLVIASANGLWFRTIGSGVHLLQLTIAKEFKLTLEQAKQVLAAPAKCRQISRLYAALHPRLNDWLEQIQSSLQQFHELLPDRPVDQMFVTGGGAGLHGLLRYLIHGPDPLFL